MGEDDLKREVRLDLLAHQCHASILVLLPSPFRCCMLVPLYSQVWAIHKRYAPDMLKEVQAMIVKNKGGLPGLVQKLRKMYNVKRPKEHAVELPEGWSRFVDLAERCYDRRE